MRGVRGKMPRIRMTFDQTGLLKYISHLDTMRLFERACRRADMPLELTQGFNPHPKISIIPARPVGQESAGQFADITLKIMVSLREIAERMNRNLPPEILITGVREVKKVKTGGKTQWV
jgi:radical SAM-linked protein